MPPSTPFLSSDIKQPASDTLVLRSHITVATVSRGTAHSSRSYPTGIDAMTVTSFMTRTTSTSLALLFLAFSLNAYDALGQTAEPSAAVSAKSDKAKRAADFAAKEKAMQDMSRSSASGAVGSIPATQAIPYNKDKNAGQATIDEAAGILNFKGSKPVDKNAKAVAPMKSLSKMTPEERAELRKEVVKEAKP